MKPGAFIQIYIQLVFAVKFRDNLITKDIKSPLFAYVGGIISKRSNKPIIINGMPDHIHIFLGLNPKETLSDLVGCVKRESSNFINKNKLCYSNFRWQEGYGAFSYSRSQINSVYNYIMNQENHHKEQTFRKEYIQLLKIFNIEFDEKYLFEFFN